eukprot:g5199.t1
MDVLEDLYGPQGSFGGGGGDFAPPSRGGGRGGGDDDYNPYLDMDNPYAGGGAGGASSSTSAAPRPGPLEHDNFQDDNPYSISAAAPGPVGVVHDGAAAPASSSSFVPDPTIGGGGAEDQHDNVLDAISSHHQQRTPVATMSMTPPPTRPIENSPEEMPIHSKSNQRPQAISIPFNENFGGGGGPFGGNDGPFSTNKSSSSSAGGGANRDKNKNGALIKRTFLKRGARNPVSTGKDFLSKAASTLTTTTAQQSAASVREEKTPGKKRPSSDLDLPSVEEHTNDEYEDDYGDGADAPVSSFVQQRFYKNTPTVAEPGYSRELPNYVVEKKPAEVHQPPAQVQHQQNGLGKPGSASAHDDSEFAYDLTSSPDDMQTREDLARKLKMLDAQIDR